MTGCEASRIGDCRAAAVQLQSSLDSDLTGEGACEERRGLCRELDRFVRSIGACRAIGWVGGCRVVIDGLDPCACKGAEAAKWWEGNRLELSLRT